jgi:hypothetical protein
MPLAEGIQNRGALTSHVRGRCWVAKHGSSVTILWLTRPRGHVQEGQRILCRHPFSESKRAYVVPQRVEPLYHLYWAGDSQGAATLPSCTTSLAEV